MREDGWSIYLEQIEPGERFALLITAEVSGSIQVECSAEGLSVTVGDINQDRLVRILVDGYVPSGDGNLIHIVTDELVHMIDAQLYGLDSSGAPRIIPLKVKESSSDTKIDVTSQTVPSPPEPESYTETEIQSHADTVPSTYPSSSTESESERESDPFASYTYLGCRETDVKNHTYAVQFLFDTKEKNISPAVICFSRGTYLTLTVEALPNERGWIAGTFRGLQSDETYIFLVSTSDGVVCVEYSNGTFVGQYVIEKRKKPPNTPFLAYWVVFACKSTVKFMVSNSHDVGTCVTNPRRSGNAGVIEVEHPCRECVAFKTDFGCTNS